MAAGAPHTPHTPTTHPTRLPLQIPTAVFCSPPLGTVGMSEEQAVGRLGGEVDVYVSRFRPMKNTLSGRDEKTFMKMLVHVPTDRVRRC